MYVTICQHDAAQLASYESTTGIIRKHNWYHTKALVARIYMAILSSKSKIAPAKLRGDCLADERRGLPFSIVAAALGLSKERRVLPFCWSTSLSKLSSICCWLSSISNSSTFSYSTDLQRSRYWHSSSLTVAKHRGGAL